MHTITRLLTCSVAVSRHELSDRGFFATSGSQKCAALVWFHRHCRSICVGFKHRIRSRATGDILLRDKLQLACLWCVGTLTATRLETERQRDRETERQRDTGTETETYTDTYVCKQAYLRPAAVMGRKCKSSIPPAASPAHQHQLSQSRECEARSFKCVKHVSVLGTWGSPLYSWITARCTRRMSPTRSTCALTRTPGQERRHVSTCKRACACIQKQT